MRDELSDDMAVAPSSLTVRRLPANCGFNKTRNDSFPGIAILRPVPSGSGKRAAFICASRDLVGALDRLGNRVLSIARGMPSSWDCVLMLQQVRLLNCAGAKGR